MNFPLVTFPRIGFFQNHSCQRSHNALKCRFSFIHVQVVLGIFLVSTCSVMLLKRKEKLKTQRGFARCLQIAGAGTVRRTNGSFASDVLRFIHQNGYLIVPPSNPPTPQQKNIPAFSKTTERNRRELHSSVKQRSSDRCPFNMTVVDFVNTVPRFLSKATRDGFDACCKPVMYTHQVLFKRYGNYWMWT